MSRRPASLSRRLEDASAIPFMGSLHPKSRPSPMLSVGLILMGAFLMIGYVYYSGSGGSNIAKTVGGSCSSEIYKTLPYLKKAYGNSMQKVLHVGPDTCTVVSKLLQEENTEAWGVEPYDSDDNDENCVRLVRKGTIRVADIKYPLAYKSKSFSLVVVSDALDYLSPKYLNTTLLELARVASDGIVVLSGLPGQQRVKVAEMSKFGRPAKLRSSSWWVRFFAQSKLEENKVAKKKFENAAVKNAYESSCQIFHLKLRH